LIEVGALVSIFVIFRLSHVRQWHDRWIDYRLLSELRRSALVGMQIGRPLPRRFGIGLARSGARSRSTKRQWVAWFFDSHVRAAAPLAASFDAAFLGHIKQ